MIGLYLRTARYYKLSQIAGRIRMTIDRRLERKVPALMRSRYAVPTGIARDPGARFFIEELPDCRPYLAPSRENANRLSKGTFRLLNTEVALGEPVNWNPADTTRLWRYNLHYFDYALDLALVAKFDHEKSASALLLRFFREWTQANPPADGVGWHSYTLSRRIVNWIQSVSLVSPANFFPDKESEAEWLASLFRQARYLEDHIEFDLQGNHVLANARALVFAGILFGGKDAGRWLRIGQQLLWQGLKEQFLTDGGHYERSPMYHASMLQDYLEIVLVHQLNQREIPGGVNERLVAMTDFLAQIRHPDGEIPLFADSALGITHSTSDILAASERLLGIPGRWQGASPGLFCAMTTPARSQRSSVSASPFRDTDCWPATGYVALNGRESGDRLIVDARPMGPSHLPAHGHCSLFSYELSLAGQRVIVDSGVEEYERGPWRQFWRSTRAHNTVSVDHREQSEIWAAFRVGGRVSLLESTRLKDGTSSLFVGMHGGFAGQSSTTPHRRFIAALSEGLWVVVDDVLGNGSHTVESYIHFVPGVVCTLAEGNADVVLDSTHLRIYPLRSQERTACTLSVVRGAEKPIQGWYAPQFGVRQANSVLTLSTTSELPARIGYLIVPAGFVISSWEIAVSDFGKPIQVDLSLDTAQGKILKHFDESSATAQRLIPNS